MFVSLSLFVSTLHNQYKVSTSAIFISQMNINKRQTEKSVRYEKEFRIARINYSPSHEAPDYLLLWVSKTNINNLNDSQADREGATRSLCINFRLTTNSMLKNSWNFNFTLLILPSQNFSPDCECKALFGTELLERDKNIIILW